MKSKHHVVPVSREVFVDLMEKLAPECRFVNVEQWSYNHFWLYAPNGDVVIFTPDPDKVLGHEKPKGSLA